MRLFHHERRLMAQILGYEEELPDPAIEEDLVAVEEEFGVSLPPDLRALYGIANGDGDLIIGAQPVGAGPLGGTRPRHRHGN